MRKLPVLAVLAAALALAGCAAMPIAPYDQPSYRADAAQLDLRFEPGSGALVAGDADRLDAFMRAMRLRPRDNAQVYLTRTGSPGLDAARVATLGRVLALQPSGLQVLGQSGPRSDTALVVVQRSGALVVTCPNSALDTFQRDVLQPVPALGCANAMNLAHMAARPRDLTAPGALVGSDGVAAVAAVGRYRADKVKVNRYLDTTRN